MRRSVIVALLVTAALVAWVFWRPAHSGPAPALGRAAPAPVGRAEAPGPRARVALMRVETRLPVARGLCGTEIERPARAPEPRRVPDALRALATKVPRGDDVVAAAREWGITTPDGLELADRVVGAEERRRELEEQLTPPPRLRGPGADDDEDDGEHEPADARLSVLRELGRPREALALAEQQHARDPSVDTALTLASLLDDTGNTIAALRTVEIELQRATDDFDRGWLNGQLGFICATHGELQCARTATQSLERLDGADADTAGLASFTRGVERTFAGRLDEARAAYLQSQAESPDFVTLNNLAEVEGCMGLQDESRQRWVQAADSAWSPEANANVLAGLGMSHLRAGEVAPAWIMASAALVAAGAGSHSTDARLVMSLAALTMGDLDEARAQVARARAADPEDDLQRRRCFAHPAEGAAARALVAEARRDLDGARAAWLEVARSGHEALAATAREALGALCP
jgi:tetratricopeptide (TPR) repeat protein